MPKGVKKSSDVSESVVAPVAVAPVAADVKAKKVKAPKVETVAPVVTASVVTAPVVTAPVVDAPVDEVLVDDLEVSLSTRSTEFMAKLNQWCAAGVSLKTEFRNLEKDWARRIKVAQKSSSKRKKRAVARTPSGFVKPTRISTDLAKFLGKSEGTEMARTDVTREINTYIRLHNLQDKENGRKILPDAKLSALLKVSSTDELTYFNLQKFLSPHFFKTVKADATATAVGVSA
jgi:upstream activation factor subunit UAF30